MRRALAALGVAALAFGGCGGPATQEGPPAGDATPGTTRPRMSAEVRVVDLGGAPLPGLLPIVTRRPNAFDEPLAQGPPTNADGYSAVPIPQDEHVFVRAWDPTLQWFPNNFYELLPGGDSLAGVMIVQMARSARFEVTLLRPDGRPVADENVGLMMFHPTQGPWWPGEGDTDAEGRVRFGPVPPGSYLLKLKALTSGQVEMPETLLPPGEAVSLAPVVLMP